MVHLSTPFLTETVTRDTRAPALRRFAAAAARMAVVTTVALAIGYAGLVLAIMALSYLLRG